MRFVSNKGEKILMSNLTHNHREPVWVLGLNSGGHDSAAALLCNGELIAMAEQERFSRNKRAPMEVPFDAIRYCLDYAGITVEDLVAIGFGLDMKARNEWLGLTEQERVIEQKLDDPSCLFPKEVFQYNRLPPIISVRHHMAHAASAFWPSGFDEAAILIADNRGENTSTTLAYGRGADITFLEEYGISVSLGLYYRIATQYPGLYKRFGEVGKLMGLAAYGRPNQRVPLLFSHEGPVFDGLAPLPPLRGKDIPTYRTHQLLDYFSEHCYPFAIGTGEDVMAYANFAASVQQSLEATLLGLVKRLKDTTSSNKLVIAGGVGLNCSANGKIAASGLFDQLFVQPAAHDAGVSLGAALEVTRQLCPNWQPSWVMEHTYWGPAYDQKRINKALDQHQLNYALYDAKELPIRVAEHLAARKIVGWFQGRMEIGPRALGARSLLGNPGTRETLIRLNQIKGREIWRPLAPSVLVENFSDYFTGEHASPFMIVATQVHPHVQRLIPAVVHVDGSVRPQAVNRSSNERYWKMIRAFADQTGLPLVVNTSFNLEGEPIVNTPEEAIRDFLERDIDVLALGDALVTK